MKWSKDEDRVKKQRQRSWLYRTQVQRPFTTLLTAACAVTAVGWANHDINFKFNSSLSKTTKYSNFPSSVVATIAAMSSHFSLHVPSRPALYTSASNMERFDEDGTTLSDLENDVPTSDDEYMVSDDESDPEEIGHASRLTSSTKARRSKSTSPDADEQFSRTDYRKKIFDSITLKLSPSNDEFRRKRQIRPHTQEEFWKLILESDEKLASARRRLAQTTENRQKEKRKSCDDKLQKKEKTASLSRKVGQLDESLKEARQEIKTLRETAVSREKIIQGMKDQRLNTEAGNFDADADQPVASELASLFQSSKSFSARWTLGDWSKIDAQMKKVLLDKLRDMPNLVSQHGQTAIAHQLISPRVIVNALLNQALVGLTLANPWKVFDGIEFYSHKFFLAEVLERIYDMHEKGNLFEFVSTAQLTGF